MRDREEELMAILKAQNEAMLLILEMVSSTNKAVAEIALVLADERLTQVEQMMEVQS